MTRFGASCSSSGSTDKFGGPDASSMVRIGVRIRDSGRWQTTADQERVLNWGVPQKGTAQKGTEVIESILSCPRRASAGRVAARWVVAEGFLHHGLELGVAQRAFLSKVFPDVFQFLGTYCCLQSRLIRKSTFDRIRIQGQIGRMRGD